MNRLAKDIQTITDIANKIEHGRKNYRTIIAAIEMFMAVHPTESKDTFLQWLNRIASLL